MAGEHPCPSLSWPPEGLLCRGSDHLPPPGSILSCFALTSSHFFPFSLPSPAWAWLTGVWPGRGFHSIL